MQKQFFLKIDFKLNEKRFENAIGNTAISIIGGRRGESEKEVAVAFLEELTGVFEKLSLKDVEIKEILTKLD